MSSSVYWNVLTAYEVKGHRDHRFLAHGCPSSDCALVLTAGESIGSRVGKLISGPGFSKWNTSTGWEPVIYLLGKVIQLSATFGTYLPPGVVVWMGLFYPPFMLTRF